MSHPEITALLAHLTAQRHHVLGILDDLDEETLRRPLLPSGWSCAALVQHLALDVERFWFRGVVAGNPADLATGDGWQLDPDTSAKSVLEVYRQEIDLADVIIAAATPDSAPAWWPEGMFGDWRIDTVREVILHVIVETACHAGHLDAARELVDGRQWFVMPG